MSRRKLIIIYALLWIIYIPSTFIFYPVVNISGHIPAILLVGLGAWWFGRSAGIWLSLLTLIHSFVLTGLVFADDIIFYQYAFSGCIILPSISTLMGHLRDTHDAIKQLSLKLEQRVRERNIELNALTSKLLKASEMLKISHAEGLHDGIGQQLTGIQLLSSSLYEHLLNEGTSSAALADHLLRKASKTHHQIRKVSRLLFPVRIEQVGIMAALSELSATIQDLKKVKVHFVKADKSLHISDDISLQLYRICQECTLYAIDHLNADELTAQLSANKTSYCVRLAHNGPIPTDSKNTEPEQLLKYRLQQISGTLLRYRDSSGNSVLKISCPEPHTASDEATL